MDLDKFIDKNKPPRPLLPRGLPSDLLDHNIYLGGSYFTPRPDRDNRCKAITKWAKQCTLDIQTIKYASGEFCHVHERMRRAGKTVNRINA